MAIACAGYRVTAKTGHHKITFDSAILALGSGAVKYGDYFETCRRKRNIVSVAPPIVVSVMSGLDSQHLAPSWSEHKGWSRPQNVRV